MYILLPKLLQEVQAYDADLSAVFNYSLPYSFITITFCFLKTNGGFFPSPRVCLFHLFLLYFMILPLQCSHRNQKVLVRPNCHILFYFNVVIFYSSWSIKHLHYLTVLVLQTPTKDVAILCIEMKRLNLCNLEKLQRFYECYKLWTYLPF